MGRRPESDRERSRDRPGQQAVVAVYVVALTVNTARLQVVLCQRTEEPARGLWALPGDLLDPDETLEQAAERIVKDTLGIEMPLHLEQLGAYDDAKHERRARVVSVVYRAVLSSAIRVVGIETGRCRLVPVESVLGPPSAGRLAFDHDLILANAVARAREQLSSTSLATSFVGPEFTLADLRGVYEAAWGTPLDAGNFRRKVLATPGLVAPTGRRASSGSEGGKPAETYWADSRTVLNPPLQPPPSDAPPARATVRLGRATVRPSSSDPWIAGRAAVWRIHIGDDGVLQSAMLDSGTIALVAAGDAPISDEEWDTFASDLRVGDWVLAVLDGDRVAIGRITGPVRERPGQRDRRFRRSRSVDWLGTFPRSALDEDMRRQLDGPGSISAVRVSLGALRLERLVQR